MKRSNRNTRPLWHRLNAFLLARQRRCADLLNRGTEHWTATQKKLAFAAFCLIMGANSGVMLYKALHEKSVPGGMAKPDVIVTVPLQRGTPLRHQARKQQQALAAWVDSLEKTDSGRVVIQRLRKERPGMWDSLTQLISP